MKKALTVGMLTLAMAGCKESPTESIPDLGVVDSPSLLVGQAWSVPLGASGIRIPGGGAGAEFTLIPFAASATQSANVVFPLAATGIGAATGGPNPSLQGQRVLDSTLFGAEAPVHAAGDAGFKARLREMEERDLTPLLRAAHAPELATVRSQSAAASRVPAPGELLRFNVRSDSACATPDMRTGRVVAVSQRAIVVADTANPRGAGTFSDDEYRAFGTVFDQTVWPMSVENFGEPHDVDGNNRVVIFFTRAVNELTPRNNPTFINGFFFGRDLLPATGTGGCTGSNVAEIIYMLVPDPLGAVNGNRRTKEGELSGTVRTIAHEFQHLINASRRIYVVRATGDARFEEAWLNEGLSHIAEELMAFASSGLAPRQNIDWTRLQQSQPERAAFNTYVAGNFSNFARYLVNPDTTSLFSVGTPRATVDLPTRGATWHFLRYAADRRVGGTGPQSAFWRELIDTNTRGMENLRRVVGADPMTWIQDWLVAVYADDALAGVDPRFATATWNMRSLYPMLTNSAGQPTWGRYPLKTRALGAQESITLRAGSAAYLRFGVAGGDRAEVTFGNPGTTSNPALRFTLLRTR
jgi:hypothetical protein